MDLAAWLDKLNAATLPALGHSRDRLLALCADENVGMARIVETIEEDLGLTVRLLRHINGLSHKHLKSEVTTVTHGQMMLGLNQLQRLPEGLPTVEELEPQARLRLLQNFSQCYQAAHLADTIARRRSDMEPGELFMAALLRDLGRVLLCLHAPEKMAELEALIAQQEREPEEAEYVVFGFGIDELTHALVEAWGLPSLVADSLSGENAANNRIYGVMLASQLAHASRRGWYRAETLELLEQLADHLLLSLEQTIALVHADAVEAARATAFYGIRPVAAELVTNAIEVEETATQKPSPEVAKLPHEGTFCLSPNLPLAARNLRELANHMDGSLTMGEAIKLATQALHEGLGLNRVVFFLLSRDKSQLNARSVVGAEHEPHFNRFHIDLYTSKLFRSLMSKQQSLWLDDPNREKFQMLLPGNFFDITHNDSCYLMSVFVKGKPVGLFYADRHSHECRLDERSYRHFKKVVIQTAQTMGHLHGSGGS